MDGGFNFTGEGLVGSLGSHSIREASDLEISTTLFPVSPTVISSNYSLYMQWEGQGCCSLSKKRLKRIWRTKNLWVKLRLRPLFQSKDGEISMPCYQLQKQWRDLYLIGLLPQLLRVEESGCYWKPASSSPQPMNLSDLLSQPFSCGCSPRSAPGRFASLSSPRSSPWQSNHTLSASAKNESLRQSVYAVTSNPIYDIDKMPSLPTTLGTVVSSPCGHDTPPLTPMRATLSAYSIPLSISAMSNVSSLASPAVNSDSWSSKRSSASL